MNVQEQMVQKILDQNTKPFSIIPNPDFIHRKEIEEAIKENDGYCCCAIEKNADTKCMCKDFSEQDHYGFCHCERYYKVLKCKKVCLCGSTKFKDDFIRIAKDLTLEGYIVTMPNVFVHQGDYVSPSGKAFLDEIHKAKIADADVVYVVNVGGYIGHSTKDEIEWAEKLGKEIQYLE